MSRTLRKVPPSWEHPRDTEGNYIPMYERFPYSAEEIAEGLEDGWLNASKPNYGIDLMPTWSESEATHFQLYETVTEGTPVSPIFADVDELCDWAAENATTFGLYKATSEQWKAMLWEGYVHHREERADGTTIIFM